MKPAPFTPDRERQGAPEPPVALPPRKHRWAEPFTVTENTGSGAQETHRRCIHCNMVKVTVHPPEGLPYRAWIAPNGVWGTRDLTPPCTGMKEGEW